MQINLEGKVAIVTLANSPQLLARNFPRDDDSRVPMTQAEFLTRAWKLANDKARELGWIA